MTSSVNPEITRHGNCHILYDTSLITKPVPELFSPDWLARQANVEPIGSGRGQAWFVNFEQQQWILRHYLRGGLVAKLNRDKYLGWNRENTRSWKEWRLLHHMFNLDLPVPRPVAAQAFWPLSQFSGLYQANILVQRIPYTQTLATLVRQSPLNDTVWQAIGRCLRQFHQHDIYHADLNANNILLDHNTKTYLIDFDRGRICQDRKAKFSNILRLRRSLIKLQNQNKTFYFNEKNWSDLLQGYEDNTLSK